MRDPPALRVSQARCEHMDGPRPTAAQWGPTLGVPTAASGKLDGPSPLSRIVGSWLVSIGLDPAAYGTHSMRRTKPTLIYRRTRSLRAVQLLLGHSKLESTVRYLGIEVDDALEIAEQTEV